MSRLRFDKLTNLPFVLPVPRKNRIVMTDNIKKQSAQIHADIQKSPEDTTADRKMPDLQEALDQFSSKSDPWTQKEINEWQHEIFGLDNVTPLAEGGVMDKLEEEVSELRTDLESFRSHPSLENRAKVGKELADIVIVAYQIGGIMNIDVQEQVASKMEINVSRDWDVNESGSGRHR